METKTVLIVEDDQDLGDALRDALRVEGYEPLVARTFNEGLKLAEQFRPQAALLDLKLPDGQGTELLARLRRLDPDCFCTVLTAHPDLDSAVAAVESGAAHYLRKPVRPPQLLQLLRQAFEATRLRNEKRAAEEALRRRTEQLTALLEAAQQLNTLLELPLVLRMLVVSATHVVEATGAMAGLVGEDGVRFTELLKDETWQEIVPTAAPARDLAGCVLDHSEPYLCDDLEGDALVDAELRGLTGQASLIGIPIPDQYERPMGCLLVFNARSRRPYGPQDVEVLRGLVHLAATGIINARLLAEQRQACERIRQQSAETEEFVRTVAHGLKSPRVSISGLSGYIAEDARRGRADRLEENANEVVSAVQHMGGLLDDLLHLHRVSRIRHESQTVIMTDLLQEIVRNYEKQIADSGVQVDIPGDLPVLWADQDLLREIFDNLLSNALKYGIEGEPLQITVWYERRGDELVFSVRDNGPGIPAEHHARIFELFRRLNRQTQGTGVGLAIVKRASEALGGRAWVESAPGHGATFWIALPASLLK